MTSLVGGFFDPSIDYFMRAEIRRQDEVRGPQVAATSTVESGDSDSSIVISPRSRAMARPSRTNSGGGATSLGKAGGVPGKGALLGEPWREKCRKTRHSWRWLASDGRTRERHLAALRHAARTRSGALFPCEGGRSGNAAYHGATLRRGRRPLTTTHAHGADPSNDEQALPPLPRRSARRSRRSPLCVRHRQWRLGARPAVRSSSRTTGRKLSRRSALRRRWSGQRCRGRVGRRRRSRRPSSVHRRYRRGPRRQRHLAQRRGADQRRRVDRSRDRRRRREERAFARRVRHRLHGAHARSG